MGFKKNEKFVLEIVFEAIFDVLFLRKVRLAIQIMDWNLGLTFIKDINLYLYLKINLSLNKLFNLLYN